MNFSFSAKNADQLFDPEKDPTEQVNLATDPMFGEVLMEMKNVLKGYTTSLPGKFEL